MEIGLTFEIGNYQTSDECYDSCVLYQPRGIAVIGDTVYVSTYAKNQASILSINGMFPEIDFSSFFPSPLSLPNHHCKFHCHCP